MERKIGEIFEFGGEWYQCVESDNCGECSLFTTECRSGTKSDLANKVFGQCSKVRGVDKKYAIFKKLEKVGLPYYNSDNKLCQQYKCYSVPLITDEIVDAFADKRVIIEVKQNKKEDMEIDKVVMNIDDRDYLLDRLDAILHDTHCQQYKDEVCEALLKYIVTRNTSDLKPFDLNSAKAGKPVCTRDGRKVRIICFDRKDIKPIVALVTFINGTSVIEKAFYYFEDGHHLSKNDNNINDLMMLPEKKEGWVNIYDDMKMYASEERAKIGISTERNYITTTKVEWEE